MVGKVDTYTPEKGIFSRPLSQSPDIDYFGFRTTTHSLKASLRGFTRALYYWRYGVGESQVQPRPRHMIIDPRPRLHFWKAMLTDAFYNLQPVLDTA